MILDIPFYKNEEGNQCMQVAMKSVLKHILERDYSLKELDTLTERRNEFWTFTSQVARVLYDLGLNVVFYSKEDLECYLEGEPFIKRHYGKDAEKILGFTDIPVLINSIKYLLKYNIFEKKKISLEEIEDYMKKGGVPLILIDNNKISGKEDLYQGHFVVVTGFDEGSIYYHESGPINPEPNKKVKKEIFIEAMDANGTDNDCIIVFGKKKN